MNSKKLICRIAAFWLLTVSAWAVPTENFKAANALYDAGKFTEAIAALEKVEPRTAAVYFNLGNACFRAGQPGRAVLNFERARQLSPNDPDILANLKYAEEHLGVLEINQTPGYLVRLMQSVADSCTIRQWSLYEIFCLWLVIIFVAGAIWWPRWRTGLVILATVAGFLWAESAVALSYRVMNERNRPATVVVASKTDARFAPLQDATIHFPVGEGTRVSIVEDRGQWLLVERADSQQGWVKADAVERVAWPVLNK